MNPALINDLQDFIIIQCMKSKGENYIKNRSKAIEKMNALNELINQELQSNILEKRPPNLWNNPQTLLEDHQMRFSSEMLFKKSNRDLLDLFKFIEDYSVVIRSTNPEKWNLLIDSVIDIFAKNPGRE